MINSCSIKINSNHYRRITVCLFALVTALLSTQSALANEYKIEVLAFRHLDGAPATESHHYQPPKNLNSKAKTWYVEPSMLVKEARALRESPEYQVIHYYSWGQEALPSSQAAVYNIVETDLSGWVKVYAKNLLFANLDLDLNGYRMTENRRLKLDEENYFDHPKFGVLLRVSRLLPSEQRNNIGKTKTQ